MIPWCANHLSVYVDYFKTRLASAQCRANALTIQVSPIGATKAVSAPPWQLTAHAARELVIRPLRMVLENDSSDRMFVESTVSSFSSWCGNYWIAPVMGGGSAMQKDIVATSTDVVERWRTFYLFDSDRLHHTELNTGWVVPNGDGCQGHAFELACAAMPANRWHRLKRRSIENYLPQTVLSVVDSVTTTALFSAAVGSMSHFYNIKKGLAGDGVSPIDPKKSVRATRCQGFWASLPPADISALEKGFGTDISHEFKNVPTFHPWSADIVAEMNDLTDALQDAM